MAVDIRDQKLLIAEFENDSLDIVDLKAAKRIYSISNNDRLLNEPQAVVFLPKLNRIFVSKDKTGR